MSSLNETDELGEVHLVADPDTHTSTVVESLLPVPEGSTVDGAIVGGEGATPRVFHLAVAIGLIVARAELGDCLGEGDLGIAHLVAGVEGRIGLEGHWLFLVWESIASALKLSSPQVA